MFCKYCGAELNDDQDVCLKCGKKVEKDAPASDPFATKSANLGGQNKWLMALLCFFLGCFGVHNFVMGETKKGVLKIILTVTAIAAIVSFVLMVVDLVKILTDSYVVNKNNYV